MRLFVLRAGDTVPLVAAKRGQFLDLIQQTVGEAWTGDWAVVDVRTDAKLPDPSEGAGFIITGSSSSVTERAPWMLRTEAWIREAAALDAKILGICYGHQIVAQALGGEVKKNPRGREVGTVRIMTIAKDPIFTALPKLFYVNTTHVDTVAKLPAAARILASTALEPVAAYSIGPNIRGVQFHPEMDADVMHGYIEAREELIAKDGLDPKEIAKGIHPTAENGAVLKNFVTHFINA
ncbi:MAG: glutamine amidotransferase [Polyangiaceae bacterium]